MEELNIVGRDGWGAAPPKEPGEAVEHPVMNVVITFITDTEMCESQDECSKTVREMQSKDMDGMGLSDIKYNFVVGGDGNVYEGRGWNIQPDRSLHFPEFHGKRIDIAYVGNLERSDLPFNMLKGALQLIQSGIKKNFIHEDYMPREEGTPIENLSDVPDE